MTRILAVSIGLALSACASTPQEAGPSTGMPEAIHKAQPRYPRPLAEAGMQGCVLVSFVIKPDGRADQYVILDSVPKGLFDQATLAALNEWRFKQPPRPGRYAQKIDYRVDAPFAIPVQRECQPVPSFEELNPGAGQS